MDAKPEEVFTTTLIPGIQNRSIEPVLEKALSGGPVSTISPAEACRLIQSPDADLPFILQAAAAIRDRFKGRTVTYSRKVFLPVTNLCRDRCAYCTFRKDPDDPDAKTMTPSEIDDVLIRGREQNCKEALMCLGDKPELAFPKYRETLATFGQRTTAEYVAAACRKAIDHGLLPHTNAGILSYDEMQMLKPLNASLGLMLENISPRLSERGMAHFSAPDKDPAVRLQMLREAGTLEIPFTTGILIGIGETREERVDALIAIRDIHQTYGHIQEVIIQNFRAKPGTRMAGYEEPGAMEIARTIAVARLVLGGEMNIQAPPNLNPNDHRLLLRSGINDWGGISPVTQDYINPEAAWPHIDVLAETCREEGFSLQERLAIYAEYIDRPGFLPEGLKPLVSALSRVSREEDQS